MGKRVHSSGLNKFQRIVIAVNDFTQNAWVSHFLVPVFAYIPVGYLSFYFGLSDAHAKTISTENLSAFIDRAGPIYYATALFMIGVQAQLSAYASRLESNADRTLKNYIRLSNAFDQIVEAKYLRFKHFLGLDKDSAEWTNKKVFRAITQPEQQLHIILNVIMQLARDLTNDSCDIDVRLVDVRDRDNYEWLGAAPQSRPPDQDANALRDERSSVSLCLRKKRIVVVEDVRTEAVSREPRTILLGEEDGALICYPLGCDAIGKTQFVLTVFAHKPKAFLESREQLFKWIFEQFALRMNLEILLMHLKSEAKEHATEGANND